MAFDPKTGDLIDPDFIPADPANLSTPLSAIFDSTKTRVLVSDQTNDVLQAYDFATGNFVGTFAPTGGADTANFSNFRGISLRTNGNLLLVVAEGANADAVAELDTSGNYLGNFIAKNAGGMSGPWDVFRFGSEYLVGGINSDAIHRYSAAGTSLGTLAAIDTFPEQLGRAPNGNLLVGNFSGAQEGVVELTPAGSLVDIYDPPGLGGYRGVYELPNGNILTTNGSGVHEIDRSGNLVSTKIYGVSARMIELIAPLKAVSVPIPAPAIMAMALLLAAFGARIGRIRH